MKVSAQYAVEHFAELLSAHERGEEVEIAIENKPSLMLVPKPVSPKAKRPVSEILGMYKGKMWISPDFNAPWLNDEIADEFEDFKPSQTLTL